MNLFKQVRILRGLSQIQASEEFKTNQGNWSRMERGIHSPEWKTVIRLIDVFDLSLEISRNKIILKKNE